MAMETAGRHQTIEISRSSARPGDVDDPMGSRTTSPARHATATAVLLPVQSSLQSLQDRQQTRRPARGVAPAVAARFPRPDGRRVDRENTETVAAFEEQGGSLQTHGSVEGRQKGKETSGVSNNILNILFQLEHSLYLMC